jgi:prevent-host-death family protein
MSQIPQEISAAEFKAKCLKLMDSVELGRTEIIITKHGRPVAKLVPYKDESPALFGFMADTATINGDIISPIDVKWHAKND